MRRKAQFAAEVIAWCVCTLLCSAQEKAPSVPNPEKMDVLKQLSSSLEEVSQRCGRAVVQIFVRSYATPENPDQNGPLLTAESSSGSGILLTPDGFILTNSHVVKAAHSVKVQLNMRLKAEVPDRNQPLYNLPIDAKIVGIDRETDLAVIKIEGKNLPYLQFADSRQLKQGEIVLALGNPLGLDNSMSMGVVSATSRQIKPDDPMEYIQTDAPINPGNSGGPLLDTAGDVIGINTFILTQSGGSEGIGFAIPSNIARHVYEQLRTHGHVHRSQLGITGQTVTPVLAEGLTLPIDRGVIVSDVQSDGPASRAGVEKDDIITGLDGRPISSLHQLEARIFRVPPGTKLSVQLQRGEDKVDLPVTTQEQEGSELDTLADAVDPARNLVPQLGIVGLDLTKAVLELMPDLRRPAGVVIVARNASPPYSGALLQTGDVIYQVNHEVIGSVSQLKSALSKMKPGDSAVLLVEREGHLIYVPLQLD
jgi:serine protease Do